MTLAYTAPTAPTVSTAANECRAYGVLNSTDRARGFSNPFVSLTDAEIAPGWYRFTGEAGE